MPKQTAPELFVDPSELDKIKDPATPSTPKLFDESLRDVRPILVKSINSAGRIRTHYDSKAMELLKQSIVAGLLQNPILVKPYLDDQGQPTQYEGFSFYLMSGGRRLKAYQELKLETIPASIITREFTGLELKEIELAENLVREPFTEWEELELKRRIHELMQSKHGKKSPGGKTGHSIKDTAQLLHVDPSELAKDLKLAYLVKSNPELKTKFKNKTDAKRKIKVAEKRLEFKRDVEKRETKLDKQQRSVLDSVLNSYVHSTDFFKGIKSQPKDYFHLVNHDIDFPQAFDEGDINHEKFAEHVEQGLYKKLPAAQYKEVVAESLHVSFEHAAKNSWLILWFGLEHYEFLKKTLKKVGYKTSHTLGYWNKLHGGVRNPDVSLNNSLEPFFYARKGSPTIFRPGHLDLFSHRPIPPAQRAHPFQKPLPLMQEILSTFCAPKARILDCFSGSGDTVLAAWKNLQVGLGYELSDAYWPQYELRAKGEFV